MYFLMINFNLCYYYKMSRRNSSQPISPPESPTEKTKTNSFDRYMKKRKGNKPDSHLYNREMVISQKQEIIRLKQEISDLKRIIKGRDEQIQRLYDWPDYSNTKPALCNKKHRLSSGKLKKKKAKKKGGNYSKRSKRIKTKRKR